MKCLFHVVLFPLPSYKFFLREQAYSLPKISLLPKNLVLYLYASRFSWLSSYVVWAFSELSTIPLGTFDSGKFFSETSITKCEMRRRLVLICRFAVNARPSRGNLKQVFSFLSGGRVDSDGKQHASHSGDTSGEDSEKISRGCWVGCST